jgi:hypothetical protein
MILKNFLVLIALLSLLSTGEAFARKGPWVPPTPTQPPPQDPRNQPECLVSRNVPMTVNNEEIVRWKDSQPNQFRERGLITGRFVTFLVNKTSHLHIDVELDTPPIDPRDKFSNHLEVIYNREFGDVTNIKPGDRVAACGDFITATKQSGPYPPSPVGAIIHWVHKSNNTRKHADGFLMINNEVYGDEGDALKGGNGRRR